MESQKHLSKPYQQIVALSGKRHQLITAVMLFDNGRRIWHHIARPEITFHQLDDNAISDYLRHFGEDAFHSPGSYFLEGPGIHLFADIFGDYYAILGIAHDGTIAPIKIAWPSFAKRRSVR